MEQILSFSKKFIKNGKNYAINIDLQNNFFDILKNDVWWYGIELFNSNEMFDDAVTGIKIERLLKEEVYIFRKYEKNNTIITISAMKVASMIFGIVLSKLNVREETINDDFFHKRLEFHGKTSKGSQKDTFWEVTVKKEHYMVQWGKIGSKGSIQTKEFPSAYEAKTNAKKKIKSKKRAGYIEI